MTIYSAPLKDIDFLLGGLLKIDEMDNLPVFSNITPDLGNAIVGEAAKLAENAFHPANATGGEEAFKGLRQVTERIFVLAKEAPENLGAIAHYYLNMFAIIIFGYFWMRTAVTAKDMLQEPEADTVFPENKIKTAEYFFTHILPDYAVFSQKTGSETVVSMDPEYLV